MKLIKEIGGAQGCNRVKNAIWGTIYYWRKTFKDGRPRTSEASYIPHTALSLNDELIKLGKRVKSKIKKSAA